MKGWVMRISVGWVFLLGVVGLMAAATPSRGEVVHLSYVFDLNQGSQFEVGEVGSGVSVFRTLADTSQSFTLVNGDVLEVDVAFLPGQGALLLHNASNTSPGREIIGLEIPNDELRSNGGDTTIDITGFSGDLISPQISFANARATGLLSPRVPTNITDTQFVLTQFSLAYTVVDGLNDPMMFDSVTLALAFGTPISVVPEPAGIASLLLMALLGVRTRRHEARGIAA